MLLRISGGVDGIKIYLVTGKKAGRSFSRDELDARVVLTGDLDLTDSIIQSIPKGRERYLHVTIACKEDEIPREMLESIVDDFRQFAFAAYRPDEYNLYAEAHLPKIKSYTNSRTGGRVERKPHIHLVIPRINLLTGHDLNPFGLVDRQLRWLSAFQEHVNKKYGLASPKDNRRHRFTGESEMISRYKGDLFVGPHHQLRQQILHDVLNRNIASYQDFQWLLAEYGVVRVRNAGRLNEYLNVKPEGAAKGANLKDAVFSRDFIEAPAEEKRRRLSEMMAQNQS